MAKTILIVDDSTSIRQAVAFTLKQAGFALVEGSKRQGGAGATGSSPARESHVTDLNMPVMDGLAFIKHVRIRPSSKGNAGVDVDHRIAGFEEKGGQGRPSYRMAGEPCIQVELNNFRETFFQESVEHLAEMEPDCCV